MNYVILSFAFHCCSLQSGYETICSCFVIRLCLLTYSNDARINIMKASNISNWLILVLENGSLKLVNFICWLVQQYFPDNHIINVFINMKFLGTYY